MPGLASAELIHFLLVYNHDTQTLISEEPFDDGKRATQAYLEMERKYRDQERIEIVLVGADSIETIRQIHSNYFGYGVVTDPLLMSFF